MSVQNLQIVREAEEAAEKLRKEADDLAVTTLENAKKQINKTLDSTRQKAEQEYKLFLDKTSEQADSDYNDAIEQMNNNCSALKTSLSSQIKSISEEILRKVMAN